MVSTSVLRVRVLASFRELQRALKEVVEWAETIDFAYAWMSSGEDGIGFWNVLDDEKIGRGIIGLHFAATEPYVLEHFMVEPPGVAPERVRVITDDRGTFHPKVLVAARGEERRAILGSSNFTPGGFVFNTELNVLLEGRADDVAFRDLDGAISRYWFRGRAITREMLAVYRAEAKKRRPERGGFRLPRPPIEPSTRGEGPRHRLDVSWDEYVRLLREQEQRGILLATNDGRPTYLTESEQARRALRNASHEGFVGIPKGLRRLVAGFGPDAGWYGATRPNGRFMSLVNDEPEVVAELIDRVSLSGPVPDSVVREVFRAAEGLERVGIGCVTRLLCMKRPDLFYPVNSANRRRMREAFGNIPSNADKDKAAKYLELLARIKQLAWCRSPVPSDRFERRIWRARVALLDAVFYEISTS